MRHTLRVLGILVIAGGASGCASMTSIFRTNDFGQDGTAISVDAKQRVVLTKGTRIGDIACSEPSPDALSAVGGSVGVGVEREVAIKLAAAVAEQASGIGLRTQSIQLLRDAMYRLCEGYFSRALNQQQFMLLQQRYQNIMVALLAIEQLTGTVAQHEQRVVGAGGDAGTRGNAPASAATKDAKPEAVPVSAGAQPAGGGAGGGAKPAGLTDAQLAQIAGTVESILKTVIERDNTAESCVALLAVSYSELVLMADRIEALSKGGVAKPTDLQNLQIEALQKSMDERREVRNFCMTYLQVEQARAAPKPHNR